MTSTKSYLQETFSKSLKKEIDNELGAGVCLWKFCYSYMRLIVCYTNKELINQTKILNFINEQMQTQTFQELVNLKFKKKITIEHVNSENELHCIWEHRRDKTHPHGKVKIFCTYGLDYGMDDAGRVWSRFGREDWKLHSWAEDEN